MAYMESKRIKKRPFIKLILPIAAIAVLGLVVAIAITIINDMHSTIVDPYGSNELPDYEEYSNENISERINITFDSCVNDGYYARISFFISGLTENEESAKPFETFHNMKAVFADQPDYIIGIDGGQFTYLPGGVIEFTIRLSRIPALQPGPLLYNKIIRFEFNDLGTMDSVLIENTWICDVPMVGEENSKTFETEAVLTDLDYSIRSIVISPVSVYIELINYSDGKAIPIPEAIMLDDGSRVAAAGSYTFTDPALKNAVSTGEFEHIVSVDRIKSIIFSQQSLDVTHGNERSYMRVEVSLDEIVNAN